MEKNENSRVITLKDLWNLLVQRFLIIVLVASACTLVFYVASKIIHVPQYQSKATMYILRQNDVSDVGDASSEFSLALKLVNDCSYMLKSHVVLDRVITELNQDMTYRQLYNSITIYNPENTRILEVTVKSDSPERAKLIVDGICDVAPKMIEDIMGYNQVSLMEKGILNREVSNQTGLMAYVLVFLMVAVLVYALLLLKYLLDERMRTDEDVERVLGLTVLGVIPDANVSHRDGYRYYSYGEKSGAKKRRGVK